MCEAAGQVGGSAGPRDARRLGVPGRAAGTAQERFGKPVRPREAGNRQDGLGRGVFVGAREPADRHAQAARDGQRAGQAALAVLVVAGLAATALLLRPDADGFVRGRGPIGRNGGIVILLALAWACAALVVGSRYRDRVTPPDLHAGGAAHRLADVVRRTLFLAPLVVPVLLLVLHRFSPAPADHRTGTRPAVPQLTWSQAPPPPTHSAEPTHGGVHLPGWLLTALSVIGVVVGLAVVAFAAWYLWRLLRRPAPEEYAATFSATDDDREVLAQAVADGRRALLDGDDARTAVIACYVAMEQALAASGIARLASDSPTDLLERATSGGLSGGPAGAAAAELTGLFREARHSTHPMDGGHRDRAAAALAAIAAALDARAATAEAAS
jgi:hypothetical protein